MKRRSLIAVTGLAAALALPATAAAHPSVYEDLAKTAGNPPPATAAGLADQTRYVVTNHGYTMVLRETNGRTTKGVLDYKVVPGAYRNQAGFEPGAAGTRTRLLSEADSGAQAHAVCTGVAALDAEAAVLAWQGSDPFYNYVPFQKVAAGLEDDPALWIKVVKDRTGVDLNAVSDTAAACTGLGGTLQPADTVQTTAKALAAGTIAEEVKPVQDKLTAAEKKLAEADAALKAAQEAKVAAETAAAKAAAEAASAKADAAAARTEAQRLQLAAVPPASTMTATSPATFASRGAALRLTGPALAPASVRLLVSAPTAKALKLKSRVVGRVSATLDMGGVAGVTARPTRTAARALRKAKGPVDLIVETTAGGRTTSTVRTLGR